jgi:dihydrofolate reductase
MRDIVVIEYMSVDGVIQAPGHAGEDTDGGFAHGGWTGPFMAEHRRYISEAIQTAGAFLFGRRTYEIFAEYWPTVTDEGDEIARALNTLPKYVASATLTEQQWTRTTIIGDVVQDVGKLKKEPGKRIIVPGSARLTRTLLRHGLVDEYQLWVHPVVLGTGKRLFTEDTPMTTLRLVDSKTTSNGLIILTYAPAAPLHGRRVSSAT